MRVFFSPSNTLFAKSDARAASQVYIASLFATLFVFISYVYCLSVLSSMYYNGEHSLFLLRCYCLFTRPLRLREEVAGQARGLCSHIVQF